MVVFLFLFILEVSEIVIMEVGVRGFDIECVKSKNQVLYCDDIWSRVGV